jgi:hypothetical protein
MKGQLVIQVNDDDTLYLQSTKPKDFKRPMLAHYSFVSLDDALAKIKSEVDSIKMVGDITLLER